MRLQNQTMIGPVGRELVRGQIAIQLEVKEQPATQWKGEVHLKLFSDVVNRLEVHIHS